MFTTILQLYFYRSHPEYLAPFFTVNIRVLSFLNPILPKQKIFPAITFSPPNHENPNPWGGGVVKVNINYINLNNKGIPQYSSRSLPTLYRKELCGGSMRL